MTGKLFVDALDVWGGRDQADLFGELPHGGGPETFAKLGTTGGAVPRTVASSGVRAADHQQLGVISGAADDDHVHNLRDEFGSVFRGHAARLPSAGACDGRSPYQ